MKRFLLIWFCFTAMLGIVVGLFSLFMWFCASVLELSGLQFGIIVGVILSLAGAIIISIATEDT